MTSAAAVPPRAAAPAPRCARPPPPTTAVAEHQQHLEEQQAVLGGQARGLLEALGGLREVRPRVRSHCRFRNRGTEYVSKTEIKWMSGGAKRPCDRALRSATAAPSRLRRGLGHHLAAAANVGAKRLVREGLRSLDEPGLLVRCPGRKPPFFAVKRPARPYKSAIEKRFRWGNAKGAYPPLGAPGQHAAEGKTFEKMCPNATAGPSPRTGR